VIELGPLAQAAAAAANVRSSILHSSSDVSELRQCHLGNAESVCLGGTGDRDACETARQDVGLMLDANGSSGTRCAAQYCAPGLTGPYCSLCAAQPAYRVDSLGICRQCDYAYDRMMDGAFWLFVVIVAVVLLCTCVLRARTSKGSMGLGLQRCQKCLQAYFIVLQRVLRRWETRLKRSNIMVYQKDFKRFADVIINVEDIYVQRFPSDFGQVSSLSRPSRIELSNCATEAIRL